MRNNLIIQTTLFYIVLPHIIHNKFCNTRQVVDIGAASLAKPCRTGAITVRGVTTYIIAKTGEKPAIQL